MSDSKFLTGIILGAIGGVLLAPASGKETREKITDATADIRLSFQQKMKQIREKYSESHELSIEDLKRILLNTEPDKKEKIESKIDKLEASIEQKYKELESETLKMIEEFKQQNLNTTVIKNT